MVFLQETHLRDNKFQVLTSPKFLLQFQVPGTTKARGVAILFSARLSVVIEDQLIDSRGRYIFLRTDDCPYTIASIYGPNLEQSEFLDEVLTNLGSFQQGPIVLGGEIST